MAAQAVRKTRFPVLELGGLTGGRAALLGHEIFEDCAQTSPGPFFFFFCPALLWIELHQLLRKHSHVWNLSALSEARTDNRTDFHGSPPGMKVAGIFLSCIRKQSCFNLLILWRKHEHGQPRELLARQSGHESIAQKQPHSPGRMTRCL